MLPGFIHKFPVRYKFLAAKTSINTQIIPLFKKLLMGTTVFIDLGPDQCVLLFRRTALIQKQKDEQGVEEIFHHCKYIVIFKYSA